MDEFKILSPARFVSPVPVPYCNSISQITFPSFKIERTIAGVALLTYMCGRLKNSRR